MPLNISRFIQLRPYLYHLTSTTNLPGIAESGSLRPAWELLTEGGREDLRRRKRGRHTRIKVRDQMVVIRDQEPRFNSGSPRWSSGKPSPRGPNTFAEARRFAATTTQVVEVFSYYI